MHTRETPWLTLCREPNEQSDGTRDEHVHHSDDDDEGEDEEEDETVDEKLLTVWFNPHVSILKWRPPDYVPGKVGCCVCVVVYWRGSQLLVLSLVIFM